MAKAEFKGKLEVEWISVKDRLPLDEYNCETFGMLAYVFVLLVDEEDLNEDPTVVDICYTKDNNNVGQWEYTAGEPYPKIHVDRIRYWCYHPYYRLQDILDWEMRNK